MDVTAMKMLDGQGKLVPAPVACDPFALLGVPRVAVVDSDSLRRAFLALSRKIHPDRFQALGGEQLARAEAWTGLINKANATLKQQRARVLWLLTDAGLVAQDPSTAAGTSGIPNALLAEVFELRELLEAYADAPSQGVRSEIEAARKDFAARLDAIGEAYQSAAIAWDSGEQGKGIAAEMVKRALSEEHFFHRLLGEIEAVLGAALS